MTEQPHNCGGRCKFSFSGNEGSCMFGLTATATITFALICDFMLVLMVVEKRNLQSMQARSHRSKFSAYTTARQLCKANSFYYKYAAAEIILYSVAS